LKEEIWDKVWDGVKQQTEYLPLKGGVKVFKILSVDRKIKTKSNDYTRAREEYLNTLNKEKGMTERYQMRGMKVRILYWNGKPYKDMEVNTNMSEKVFRRIILTRRSIKQEGINPPEYLAVWKKNMFTVVYAFITETEFGKIDKLCNKDNWEKLSKAICWTGAKVKFIKDEFLNYYRGIEE